MNCDFALPDDATMDEMKREFDKAMKGKKVFVCSGGVRSKNQNTCKIKWKNHSFVSRSRTGEGYAQALNTIFVLYIIALLVYNKRYGTEIYDAHGSVDGLHPKYGAFGNINNLG